MSSLMTHRGSVVVPYQQLGLYGTLSEKTKTYTPVSHSQLVETILETIDKDSTKFNVETAVNKNGNQLFGVVKFEDGRAIGFRNSYDKSLAVGMCVGSRVFVCDNLAFHGDITVNALHSGRLDIIRLTQHTLMNTEVHHANFQKEIEVFRSIEMNTTHVELVVKCLQSFRLTDKTMTHDIMNEFIKPHFEDFKEPNLWSAYNAVTYTLKRAPVYKALQSYTGTHRIMELVAGIKDQTSMLALPRVAKEAI